MSHDQIKAVGLLSGGLDSTLATKLMLEQGIAVHAVNFTSPFCLCTSKRSSCSAVLTAVRQLGNIPLKQIPMGLEYLEIVKAPKFGWGRGINPCIDCRIMKIKLAAGYMAEIGASFLFTGEVIGQRPMSQHRRALAIIDEESGVAGLIVRPLSAALLQATIPEQKGWIDRAQLLKITGKSRKPQIQLAKEKSIADFPCPAGGCLLTDKLFAERMRDYLSHTSVPALSDIPRLKLGRHFRLENGDKVIVARDEHECNLMLNLKRPADIFYIPNNFNGPAVILQGTDERAALEKLLAYTKQALPAPYMIDRHHAGQVSLLTNPLGTANN